MLEVLLCALALQEPAPAANPSGLVHKSAQATPGTTLIATLNSAAVHLVDLDGTVRHTWKCDGQPGGAVYLESEGRLLRATQVEPNPRFHGGGIGGRIEQRSFEGQILWQYELATAERTLHHDFARMPNGNLLAIAWEYHSPEEARALGRHPDYIHEEGLWADVVLEIQPLPEGGGKIVWEWRSIDHLVQDRDPKAANYGELRAHPGRLDINADVRFLPKQESEADKKKREAREREMKRLGYSGGDAPKAPAAPAGPKITADWLHTNAVSYLPKEDLIVLSSPHMCELWVIDHSTTTAEAKTSRGGRRGHGGDFVYRYGSPRNYGFGGKEARQLFYQHHPTWIEDRAAGTLSLLVFNNGGDRNDGKDYSSVEELLLPFRSDSGFAREKDQAFGPSQAAWIYQDEPRFFSAFISGAQRLSNGNTLICEGAKGRVFEVTRAGEIVWDYWNPHDGELGHSKQGGKAPPRALFRAARIEAGDPRLAGKL